MNVARSFCSQGKEDVLSRVCVVLGKVRVFLVASNLRSLRMGRGTPSLVRGTRGGKEVKRKSSKRGRCGESKKITINVKAFARGHEGGASVLGDLTFANMTGAESLRGCYQG